MTLLKLLGEELLLWRKKLLSKGGSAAELDWLLDIGGGLRWCDLQQIYVDPKKSVILQESLENLECLWINHLDDHIPLQHLIGRCPWRDFELEVSSEALIPRQETEILMDLALEKFEEQFEGCWVDLGTGSGVLAIALARAFPLSVGHAVDISKQALSLAKRNLDELVPDSEVNFHLGSWWEPLKPWWGSIELVLANPPYIPTNVLAGLDPIVRDHEPHVALCGGLDGLNASREILNGAFNALAKNGWLFLEHHHDQSDVVLELMDAVGLKDVGYESDLSGVRRFALGRHP